MGTKIKWEDANFKWELAPTEGGKPRYTWDEVVLVEEAVGGGGAIADDMPWTQFNDDKKKRLIKLICKVQGRTYKTTKEIQDIKITANDIKILAEKVLGIEVITENIKF